MRNKYEKGKMGEEIALRYLMNMNMKIIGKNFKCPYGEIDLITSKNDKLIFYEVKYRENENYGPIEYSIDHKKKIRLLKSAQYFLTNYENFNKYDIEFSAIFIYQSENKKKIQIIPNIIQYENLDNEFFE